MRPLSFKARMSFSVMALVLVIMVGAGVVSLHYFEQSLRQLIADQQSTLVKQIAERIDGQLKDASSLIAATADRFPLDRLKNSDLAQEYLDSHLGLGTTTLFDNGIFLFTAKGVMLAEYPFKPGRRGRDYSFRKYYQDTVTSGRPQISDPYISSQKHQHPAVNFTAPIFDKEGQIAAVIAGSVDLTRKNFLGGLSDVNIGRTGYLYLYNTDRLMIMHPDSQRIMKKDVPVGANIWFDRAIEGFVGTAETVNSRGLHTLATFKRLNDDRWILAANYPTTEAFQPIYEAKRFYLIGIVTVLLLSIAVTWVVTRLLLAPLVRLNQHVASFSCDKELKNGNSIIRGDEIATLAMTFDELMTEVVAQRRAAADRLAFLQGIMDTIPNPTFYKDLEGRFLGCNKAMQNLCRKPLEQIVDTTLFDHFSSESVQSLATDDSELIQGDSAILKREIELIPDNGEPLSVLVNKALLRDGLGNPQGIVTSLVDIDELKSIQKALAAEREFTLNLLQNSATPCFVLDLNHNVLIWTGAIEELTGLNAAEVLGTNQHWRGFYATERPCLADVVLDEAYEEGTYLYPQLNKSPLAQDGLQAEGWRTMYSGKQRYLSFDAAPINDHDGNLIAVIQTLHDLTSLKETEEALKETQTSYQNLVDSSPDAILVHRQGEILYSNHAATRLFHANEPNQLAGRAIRDLLHPDCQGIAMEQIVEVEKKHREHLYIEEKIVCFDGSHLNVEVGLSPTYYGGGWAAQSVLRDITVRKAEQERIWRQANFDALTGLPNRNLFLDRLEQTLARCNREKNMAGLLFIDLDHFKTVNDMLGHDNGDELLLQVATRMGECVRETDTVARLGGDEFTIILPSLNSGKEMLTVTSRLLKAMAEPFHLSGGTRQISCSIGGAIYPHDAKNIADLLCVADTSMYQVKQRGRNGYSIPNFE